MQVSANSGLLTAYQASSYIRLCSSILPGMTCQIWLPHSKHAELEQKYLRKESRKGGALFKISQAINEAAYQTAMQSLAHQSHLAGVTGRSRECIRPFRGQPVPVHPYQIRR